MHPTTNFFNGWYFNNLIPKHFSELDQFLLLENAVLRNPKSTLRCRNLFCVVLLAVVITFNWFRVTLIFISVTCFQPVCLVMFNLVAHLRGVELLALDSHPVRLDNRACRYWLCGFQILRALLTLIRLNINPHLFIHSFTTNKYMVRLAPVFPCSRSFSDKKISG